MEEGEEEDEEEEREVGEAVLRPVGGNAGASWGLVWVPLDACRQYASSGTEQVPLDACLQYCRSTT